MGWHRLTVACRRCGLSDWGIRHPRYRAQNGTVHVYESRYCRECSRRRGQARRTAVKGAAR